MTIKDSIQDAFTFLKQNFKSYYFIYATFVLLSIIEIITSTMLSNRMENIKLIVSVLTFILMIFNTVFFIRTLKRDKVPGDFWYILIPYLLYSIYYTFIGLVGFVLLFIPGIIFYYIPLIASFSDMPPMKTSIKMAKNNFKLTSFISVSALVIELVPISFKFIPNIWLQLILQMSFAFLDTFVLMILSIMTVNYFYRYTAQIKSPS